ncbi:hypothetical protein [Aquihabitans sp. McL0605]|uniref:hypothetical protein n=1 Tax=Aquihabitans sp. McL0605 TaxID=3415671 RepID=UPI003CEDB453
MLEDGTYDVMVVDATEGPQAISVELTVLSGPHKGELITVNAIGLQRDPLDLLAVPGTVLVVGGQPHLTLEG